MNVEKKKSPVEEFRAYPATAYDQIDLTGLAAFTLQQLNTLKIPTTFENIVVALFKLFPQKFCLIGFEQYPDAARVGRTLLQLAPKYRNWARGSVQKGFTLTESGLAKAIAVENTLTVGHAPSNTARQPTKGISRTMDLSKEIEAIENSALFRKWSEGNLSQGTEVEFFDLLGAYAYTLPRTLRDRLSRMEQIARQLERADISEFLKATKQQFEAYSKE